MGVGPAPKVNRATRRAHDRHAGRLIIAGCPLCAFAAKLAEQTAGGRR